MNGKKVTVIEPNQRLKEQTTELIGLVDQDISVVTPEWFYEFQPKDEIIIVNEFDELIFGSPFMATVTGIQGLWSLMNRRVIFFSATTHKCMERIIQDVLGSVVSFSFKSEYEIMNEVSSVTHGTVKTFRDKEDLISSLIDDAKKVVQSTPVIIIKDKSSEAIVEEFLRKLKPERVLHGGSWQNLQEIRNWESGLLVLDAYEGVGTDTKFAKDAFVLILADVRKNSIF